MRVVTGGGEGDLLFVRPLRRVEVQDTPTHLYLLRASNQVYGQGDVADEILGYPALDRRRVGVFSGELRHDFSMPYDHIVREGFAGEKERFQIMAILI